jgi:hypothetical protein
VQSAIFTLEDANRALPLIRAITQDAVAAYRAAKEAIRNLAAARRRVEAGWGGDSDVDSHETTIARRLGALRCILDELEALGVRLRDYERGVVEFPAAALGPDGSFVYCWALGEHSVRHWHSEGEDYDARRLVRA